MSHNFPKCFVVSDNTNISFNTDEKRDVTTGHTWLVGSPRRLHMWGTILLRVRPWAPYLEERNKNKLVQWTNQLEEIYKETLQTVYKEKDQNWRSRTPDITFFYSMCSSSFKKTWCLRYPQCKLPTEWHLWRQFIRIERCSKANQLASNTRLFCKIIFQMSKKPTTQLLYTFVNRCTSCKVK